MVCVLDAVGHVRKTSAHKTDIVLCRSWDRFGVGHIMAYVFIRIRRICVRVVLFLTGLSEPGESDLEEEHGWKVSMETERAEHVRRDFMGEMIHGR